MIYVVKGEDTIVALTLSESATLAEPFYLFAISRNIEVASETEYYYFEDTSAHKERYNKFTFNLDLPQGEYTYQVYEAETEPSELADTTEEVIETGLLIISSTEDISSDIYL